MKRGRDQFSREVSDACNFCGIYGYGVIGTVTAHQLRGTVTSTILACRHASSAVTISTDHSSLKSLESYKYSQGLSGLHQHLDLFLSMSEVLRSVKRAKVKKYDEKELVATLSEKKCLLQKVVQNQVSFFQNCRSKPQKGPVPEQY